MLKRLLATSCLYLLITINSYGQEFVFKVMANNGSNVFKTISSKEWSPVKRGVSFNNGDVVKVADRAYLGLIHRSGKTVELINPGEFKIDDIELNIDNQKKGLGGKYTEYVMNTLQNSMEEDYSEEMITRGGESIIHVSMPSAAEVLHSTQILSWKQPENLEDPTYIIKVKGIFEDLLMEEELKGNEYILDLNHPALKDETMFVVTISSKEEEETVSKEFALDRLSEEEARKYDQEVMEIRESLGQLSPLDHIVLASYYEGKGLIVDANTSYLMAIKLSPEVPDIAELYDLFKDRHNIDN